MKNATQPAPPARDHSHIGIVYHVHVNGQLVKVAGWDKANRYAVKLGGTVTPSTSTRVTL